MPINNFSWKAKSGINLVGKEWEPAGKPAAVIVLVHGLGEHIDRYQHVAEFFNKQKFSVFSFDQMGHGKSGGLRGHEESYSSTCEDIQKVIDDARRKYPALPIFLYGHSMGASLVLYMLLTCHPVLKGAIATAPGLRTAEPVPPVKMFMAKVFNKIFPKLTMNNGLFLPGLSRDEEVVNKYKSDPLVTPMISARLGMELISNGSWMIEHASGLSTPILLMQGTEDKLVNPAATAEFASKAPKSLVTFKEWKGFYHELHNEPEKLEVLETELAWLKKQMVN